MTEARRVIDARYVIVICSEDRIKFPVGPGVFLTDGNSRPMFQIYADYVPSVLKTIEQHLADGELKLHSSRHYRYVCFENTTLKGNQ